MEKQFWTIIFFHVTHPHLFYGGENYFIVSDHQLSGDAVTDFISLYIDVILLAGCDSENVPLCVL